jgi:hypothetical protein
MSEFHKDVVSTDGVSSTPHRHGFDWWTSLGRVLASVEAVRDGRALYVLLAAFVGAGLALAAARASLGRQELNWAIGQGAAALFVAFYGAQAAGLLLMDRAMGQAPREVGDALEDALGIGHRTLLALLVMGLIGAGMAGLLLGLYWLCSLPGIGPWLFVVVVPVTVSVIGLMFTAGAAVVAPLTGPTVWAGASSWQTVRRIGRLIRGRLLQATVLAGALSVVTAVVGAAISLVVLLGGRVMAEASVWILGVDIPPQALMAGLLGQTVQVGAAAQVPARALNYISAATVGGGVVFAVALVLPTVVYLRGVCEIYLALSAGADDQADAR